MSEPPGTWEGDSPERLYVITGGRSEPSVSTELDLVTLVVAKAMAQPEMQPEHAAILRMCPSPLSVAEIAAYSGLPVSAVTVLVGDMVTARHVQVRPPVPAAQLPDVALIEAVINGLQKL
ncbi:DUF742 domain-containing protein [Streptomyces sp. RerS4]|uniref:DUF742 domain-containing protein n=1 Tax=Streptomyces sp. RerS4 TaxID=2942449 RepID=UPI00201BEAD2|nr:DUF742 domain-containing protein [Streptomyces sp. RerS4]UQW99518.1 DUF742 domain-containing protein [Streptomyces sp. RerS4]